MARAHDGTAARPRGWWTLTGLALAFLLHAGAGWWAEPGLAQGGSTNTTVTNSTTTHNTYTEVSAPAPCPPPVGVLSHTETSVTTTTTFGPAVILIGPDQSETFFVSAGTMNINTNTHTEHFYDCIAAVPVAPPAALGGVLALLLGLGAWTIARRGRLRPQT